MWDLFSTNGFSAAITVQPNDQKWLYVRRNANKWFGFVSFNGHIWAACGDKPFSINSNEAGNFKSMHWMDWSNKGHWYDLQVTQNGTKTRFTS